MGKNRPFQIYFEIFSEYFYNFCLMNLETFNENMNFKKIQQKPYSYFNNSAFLWKQSGVDKS